MNAQDLLTRISEKNPKSLVTIHIDPNSGQAVIDFVSDMQTLTYMAKGLDCLIYDLLTGKRKINA